MVAALSFTPRDATAQTEDCDGWVALHDMLPRRYPVMVQTADGPLLYGGVTSPQDSGVNGIYGVSATSETWRFDGQRWRFVTMNGPSPRYQAACAYDTQRDRVVLFGGRGTNSTGTGDRGFNETWEFGADQWTRVTTPHSPPALVRASMVYDPSRQLTFLYGGNQFWSYDGADWTQIALGSPNPEIQHGSHLIFDPSDNSIVLIPSDATATAWRWNGAVWVELTATGVQAETAFLDTERGTIVLVDSLGVFYTFDRSSAAVQVPGVTPPSLGTAINLRAVPIIGSGWLTVVGPINSNPFESVSASFIISPQSGWSQVVSRETPLATIYMTCGYHVPTGEFVLFSGSLRHGTPLLSETWILRGESWRQHLGPQPPTRQTAFLSYSPQQERTLMLGGGGGGVENWWWTGNAWQSEPAGRITGTYEASPPQYDPHHGVILWPNGGSIVVIGNERSTVPASGLNSIHGATAYDPLRHALVFVGTYATRGTSVLRSNDDLTAFHWETLFPTSQTGYFLPSMTYDPDRAGIILFGGWHAPQGGVFPRKTYFLGSDATSWSTLPDGFNNPIGRSYSSMTYDSVARRIIMHGGQAISSAYPLRETWKLARGPAAIALEPADTYVVPGETAELFIIASGGGVIEYQWFKDGVPLANLGRISGADSDTLQIQNFSSDDNGTYHVTVHNPCGEDQSIAVQLRAIPACPGDFNDSGGVDATDLADFFDAYERGLMLADVDLSGGVDASDLAAFFTSFQAGGC